MHIMVVNYSHTVIFIMQYPVDAWWKDNDTFTILSKTGMYVGIGYKPAASNHFVERKEPISVGKLTLLKYLEFGKSQGLHI